MSEVTVEGTIARVVYQREKFCIVRLKLDTKGQISVLGEFPEIGEHARVRVTGIKSTNERFGDQIKASSVLELAPSTLMGLSAYLSGGTFKGVGKATAEKIVQAFGADTFKVLSDSPSQLKKVSGVPKGVAESLIEQWAKKREVHDIMVLLRQAGLGEALADKIYDRYGARSRKVVQEAPYALAEEIDGVGFISADRIARQVGISLNSPERMRAALYYALTTAEDETGHTAFSDEMLRARMAKILASSGDVEPRGGEFEGALAALEKDKKLVTENFCRQRAIFLPHTRETEQSLADRLYDAAYTAPHEIVMMPEYALAEFEEQSGITLGELQRKAVVACAESSLTIITGGPGTGKTTILKALLHVLEAAGLKSALASPTGRAAKRMQEATGKRAQTIHRLLRYSPEAREFRCDRRNTIVVPCETCDGAGFMGGDGSKQRCETCAGRGGTEPYDAIIIDEASMLDLRLADKLLQAIPDGARIVLVGDVDQLPSVGPGCVLRDLIESKLCPVVRLDHIYRQAESSLIVENAHRILHGEMPRSDAARDFVMLTGHDGPGARAKVVEISKKVQSKFGFSPKDVQVLVPQRKGDAGMVELNRVLQESMNPPKDRGLEHYRKNTTYRSGDRVMQLKNNYDKGVFNGEVGYISGVTKDALKVRFEDEGETRTVEYKGDEIDALRLSYASTIHKAQGSEYPAVIVVLLSSFGWMLNKNLVYTAITRGRKLVVVVTDGDARAVGVAIGRRGTHRFTRLAERILRVLGEDRIVVEEPRDERDE